MSATAPQAINRLDYTPPAHAIEHIDLAVELGEEVTRVLARMVVRTLAGERPLVLDGNHLVLKSVAVDGRILAAAEYRLDDKSLTIPALPASCIVETEVEIRPQDNTQLNGLYKSSGMFCSQCEPEGFRRITYFPDRPDVMARFTTTIAGDRALYPVLLSNGNPVARGERADGRHWVKWEDPFPKPSYLFALVAGDLAVLEDSFVTRSGRTVSLRLYAVAADIDKCGHAMDSLKKAMAWDEQVFGLEYDLDIYMIVAVGDFNMGAMENKGLNVFNTKYVLAKPETATDADYSGIEAVIAHEYFHNWTGNRVTCRDWFQLSLKEGLTVFRDQQFSSDMGSAAVKRIADVRGLRAGQFPEDNGPMAHPVRPDSYIEINNFYTSTIYNKGAELLRMMHTLLGQDGFRKGMDLYFARHDGQAVTCDDFVKAMEDANGRDFSQLRLWYSQAGTPVVTAEGAYDAAARTYTLTLGQSCPPTPGQPDKQPMHIPVAVGLIGSDGSDLVPTRVLDLTEAKQSFVFEDIAAKPVPSLLRGFSAPVKLEAKLGNAELSFLMAHDSDSFNRWEAGQTLATRLLLGLIEDFRHQRPMVADPAFIAAMGRILDDCEDDPALAAQALILPSESALAEAMAVIDVDAIHAARDFLRRALSQGLAAHFLAAYGAFAEPIPYRFEPQAVGQRSLKSVCLAYLSLLDGGGGLNLAVEQFRGADNMTDALAALGVLADSDSPEREPALAAFYERWREDALVVDKWFALRAFSARADTLADVRSLLDHPAFEIKNPNKVRALIGTFTANQVRFHDASGAGYRFLADQVLRLDPLNPQVAARMTAPLGRWRRFETQRGALMRAELERIKAAPDLSRDVFEIVSKSLD